MVASRSEMLLDRGGANIDARSLVSRLTLSVPITIPSGDIISYGSRLLSDVRILLTVRSQIAVRIHES